jgi:predicted YcjX-like family ATPase
VIAQQIETHAQTQEKEMQQCKETVWAGIRCCDEQSHSWLQPGVLLQQSLLRESTAVN